MNERYQRQRQAQREAAAAAAASTSGGVTEGKKSPMTAGGGVASGTGAIPNLDESVAALTVQRLDRIHLPFLVVSSNKKTVIDCNISKDK